MQQVLRSENKLNLFLSARQTRCGLACITYLYSILVRIRIAQYQAEVPQKSFMVTQAGSLWLCRFTDNYL
jgi:hypothetical protein